MGHTPYIFFGRMMFTLHALFAAFAILSAPLATLNATEAGQINCASYVTGNDVLDRFEILSREGRLSNAPRQNVCRADWETDAIHWIQIAQNKALLKGDRLDETLKQLQFLPFTTYRLDAHTEQHPPESILPFENPRLIHVDRLPNVTPTHEVKLDLTLPPSQTKQYLHLSVKGPHEVALGDQKLEPRKTHAYYFLDNHIYALPKSSSPIKLAIALKASPNQRILSARIRTKPVPQTFLDFIAKQGQTALPKDEQQWWTSLWLVRMRNARDIKGDKRLQRWLINQLSTQRPWRAAHLLLKITKNPNLINEARLQKPTKPQQLLWWRAVQFQLGQIGLDEDRPQQTWQAIENLRTDPQSKYRADRLFAALLDDAGLYASAAKTMRPYSDKIQDARRLQKYLFNAGLLTQSSELLSKIATNKNATRSDLRAYLGWLHRAHQMSRFDMVRTRAWNQCWSCWSLFEVNGGAVFPPLKQSERLDERLVAALDRLESTNPPTKKNVAVNSENSAPSLENIASALIKQPHLKEYRGIHTVQLEQTVNVDASGLSSVRIRRLMRVTGPPRKNEIQLALEYVPDRQYIAITSAGIKRRDRRDRQPVENDLSTDIPEAKLYYDTRRRVLSFNDLKSGDVIYLDWTLHEHSLDPELPNLDGWVFPLNEEWPIAALTIKWQSAEKPLLARLSSSGKMPKSGVIHRVHLPALTHQNSHKNGYLILSHTDLWTALDQTYLSTIEKRYTPTTVLKAAAREIVGGTRDKAVQLRKLFNAVQSKVHYVGLEMGEHSRTPSWAEDVWRRKLGDCKDKATLLMALARSLDIDLKFALVRTRILPKLKFGLPTLALFDHAMVYAPSIDRYLDPNTPFLGWATLPAVVQGAQTHVVGMKKALASVPRGTADAEVIHWQLGKVASKPLDWRIKLTVKGHLAAHLMSARNFNQNTDVLRSRTLGTLTSGWTMNAPRIQASADASPKVELDFRAQPLAPNTRDVLMRVLHSKTAWYNQSLNELYEIHDLPRIFSVSVPMNKAWSTTRFRRIDLEYGSVEVEPLADQRQLRLTFTLAHPKKFIESSATFPMAKILRMLEGES